ncbi:class E sortase [Microbacterium esteraromaticum]|uniref:class E sortase n=1 Tax=Microbacterium TaxID=33882 RepID=UPI0015CCC270|nr:class E sortase [Microbacterium esteraromaticum]MBN7793986.1 class E sortase [Microbacterium esteraromaticum]MBN8424859.1 class E sortase [Microbacterium esteraromaticum]WDH78882.1 class E sortase [Microbacterium esteraromaticum]
MHEHGSSRRSRRAARRSRPRATFTSVLGELLLTAGTLVLLFVAWQMWIGDIIIGAENNAKGAELSQEWAAVPAPEPPPAIEQDGELVYEPPVLPHPDDAEIFANMLIPRFGDDYNVHIAGGTSRARTLDTIGIGLYEQSKMPGEVGNFSLAGHRTTWGMPFNKVDKLKLDDAIVVETPEGWFTYRFRTLQYVTPTQVDVLLDVPQMPELDTDERYITLTACSPLYSLAERIVAYGVFESFQPRAEGPPASLASVEAATPSAGAAPSEGVR